MIIPNRLSEVVKLEKQLEEEKYKRKRSQHLTQYCVQLVKKYRNQKQIRVKRKSKKNQNKVSGVDFVMFLEKVLVKGKII